MRYRDDRHAGKRYKTVELIIAEWPESVEQRESDWARLKIGYYERDLRDLVKSAGGYWDREKRVWWLRMVEVKRLGLESRVTD